MDNQSKANSFRYLTTICKDHSLLNTKIAFMTFKNQTSNYWFGLNVILLEYLQLLSQTFLISYSFESYPKKNENMLVNIIIFLSKLLDPGKWLQFEEQLQVIIVLSTVAIMQTILKYFLFIYVLSVTYTRASSRTWVIKIWANMSQIQHRILYFMITSLWLSFISAASEDKLLEFYFRKTEMIIISVIFILAEVILSLLFQLLYPCLLPTKSFLSSKDNNIGMLTFGQKFCIQILQITLNKHSVTTEWILVSFNLLCSLIRVIYYFTVLPNYRLKALKYEGILIAIVITSSFVEFAKIIVRSMGYQTDITFVILIWIILSFLTSGFSTRHIEKAIISLMTSTKEASPGLQIHKIIITKELRKLENNSDSSAERHGYFYLIDTAIKKNLQMVFNIKDLDLITSGETSFYCKKSRKQIFRQYLESLVEKFPNNLQVKLYLAYLYATKLDLYSQAIRIIKNIQKVHTYKYSLNASLLILEMQILMKTKYRNNNREIDLSTYVKNISLFAQLKERVVDQAKIQIELYQEIVQDNPNLEKVFNLSQNINVCRRKIENESKLFFNCIPDYYVEPIMLFAEYNLILNFSLGKYSFYYKKYHQKLSKYDKYFAQDKLVEENLYQSDNVFFLCSCERPADAGKVLYCTKNVQKMFGGGAGLYLGVPAASLSIPSLRDIYTTFYKNIAETGDHSLIGAPLRTFVYHKDGYMFEADLSINIHPYMTQGFYLTIIIRQGPPTSKEFLWLFENGDIDAATKNFSERFGLLHFERLPNGERTKTNISMISPGLGRINEAFNIIAKNELEKKKEKQTPDKMTENKNSIHSKKKKKSLDLQMLKIDVLHEKPAETGRIQLSYNEALELYQDYSSNEREIILNVPKNQNDKDTGLCAYKCTFQNVFFDSTLFKIVTLEPCGTKSGDKYLSTLKTNKENSLIRPKSQNQQQFLKQEDRESNEDFGELGLIDEKESDTNRKTETIQPQSLALGTQIEVIGTTTEGQLISPTRNQTQSYGPQVFKKEKGKLYRNMRSHSNEVNQIDQQKSCKEEINPREVREEKLVYDTLEGALKINYYPAKLKITYMFFYLLIFCVLIGLILFKLHLEDTIRSFRTIKDIISNSETKSASMLNIHLSSLLIWAINSGRMNFLNLEIYSISAEYCLQNLKDNLESINNLNNQLLINMDDFNKKVHENLFEKDIKVFDSYYDDPEQVFTLLNNFQATDRFVEVGLTGVAKIETNITNSITEIHFLLRNSANDLLVKGEVVSDMFMTIFSEEKDKIDNLVAIYLAGTLSLGIAKTIIFLVVIWRQYFNEKSIILSLTKFSHKKLYNIMGQAESFVDAIENSREIGKSRNLTYDKRVKHLDDNTSGKPDTKTQISKKPILVEKKRRYLIYTANFLCFMVTLIAAIVLICFTLRSNVEVRENRQKQLYFIERLKSNTICMATMSQDLIAGNATTMNHNLPVSDQLIKTIREVSLMRNRIPLIFIKDDFTYDDGIGAVLFTDGCFLLASRWKNFCERLELKSTKTNLINLLSLFETRIVDRKESFDASDKSLIALSNLEAKNLDSIYSMLSVITIQCEAIAAKINQEFENDLIDAKHTINTSFWSFCSCLIVYGFSLWVFFLRGFKEINNRLKGVLTNFPAELVLSNFTLKLFMTQISKFINKDL